ncbi:hypothetical protein ACJW30_04G169700 [Castanea mollissima]
MSSKVNRVLILGLLLLTALSLTWSLFFTDENMKLTEARDGKELSGVGSSKRGPYKVPAPPPPRPHPPPGPHPLPGPSLFP